MWSTKAELIDAIKKECNSYKLSIRNQRAITLLIEIIEELDLPNLEITKNEDYDYKYSLEWTQCAGIWSFETYVNRCHSTTYYENGVEIHDYDYMNTDRVIIAIVPMMEDFEGGEYMIEQINDGSFFMDFDNDEEEG